MKAVGKTVGLLLAAGASQRFGDQNKLLAHYRGKPLIAHAADAMRACALDHMVAVVRDDDVAALLSAFAIVAPKNTEPAQSDSLSAGIRVCLDQNPDRILVVLADMPRITSAHLQAVIVRCTPSRASASSDGSRRMPPACFPAARVGELLSMQGDTGAAALLRALPNEALVMTAPAMLKDVDVAGDLS
jgi:CTP:molybdopterin cytidylyltransferase MocA